ncbi:hypothetical protein F2P81_020546 [Scophthalmus maximus]|uniref:Uncharacterized protein n=1 Tax=Scophthalmus maximus TaxID=52904 RepID=A0A6A4S6B1_SCOMX|nr:hypothetical protein F2P81_020546 [Scophthalmus maximus]
MALQYIRGLVPCSEALQHENTPCVLHDTHSTPLQLRVHWYEPSDDDDDDEFEGESRTLLTVGKDPHCAFMPLLPRSKACTVRTDVHTVERETIHIGSGLCEFSRGQTEVINSDWILDSP